MKQSTRTHQIEENPYSQIDYSTIQKKKVLKARKAALIAMSRTVKDLESKKMYQDMAKNLNLSSMQ